MLSFLLYRLKLYTRCGIISCVKRINCINSNNTVGIMKNFNRILWNIGG